ncbi:MAG TPA: bifunctional aspartate kinase/homoserine dehydrogenase I [Rhodothermales bacterium]|nr:bifunctional aspartate kinase/homoserine dehydrogenase I [Rhodothermales bacterium]
MLVPAALPIHVEKFGGTSVATAERVAGLVRLVLDQPEKVRHVVVVSALGGVTDALVGMLDAALARSGAHRDGLDRLRARHEAMLGVLARPDEREPVGAVLDARFDALAELLDGVYLLRECTPRTRDAVLGVGERLAAPLVAAAFRTAGADVVALEADGFIRTDETFGNAAVDFPATDRLVRAALGSLPERRIAVVTGFIGSTPAGVATTLGRSGSDYTATILAGALDAARCTIWTDVAGVFSADPRLVPEAVPIPRLSYREAAELAYFGAQVLHPRTMLPVERKGIPLLIKSTMEPAAPGTLVSAETESVDLRVKAVSSIPDVAVVMLEGAGMLAVPGTAARAFGALAERGVNVRMVSQASSEQSICLVVDAADAASAESALRGAFATALARGDLRDIYTVPDCAVVSAVGDGMRHQPGLAGRLFATLGRAGVNVLAIAQGAAETNISAVVAAADVRAAVGALHEAFPLRRRRVHVAIAGTGTVSKKLLEILAAYAPVLLAEHGIHLRLVGLANSRRMRWAPDGMGLATAQEELEADGEPADLDTFLQNLRGRGLERRLFIDATASPDVARRYVELLEDGVGVVTPNKQANTLDMAYYRRLRAAARRREVSYHYETTVMAGLPVVFTIRDLLRSGDRVERIEGVFSGTLAFVFSRLSEGVLFSRAVQEAMEKGYTEPDPRDDLAGEDVARKVLILAREAGWEVERSDVTVESLVPEELRDVPRDAFLDRLPELDEAWAARIAAAAADGHRLYYVGRIGADGLSVGVHAAPPGPPFGGGPRGTDNVVIIHSLRYHEAPLIVQGPGAGPDVTAAGLLADLVKAAELMP